MTYNLELHELAEQELWDAIDYYDAKRHRLGREFARELQTFMKTIREHPARFPLIKDNIRKSVLKRFPYIIIFEIQEDTVCFCVGHISYEPQS